MYSRLKLLLLLSVIFMLIPQNACGEDDDNGDADGGDGQANCTCNCKDGIGCRVNNTNNNDGGDGQANCTCNCKDGIGCTVNNIGNSGDNVTSQKNAHSSGASFGNANDTDSKKDGTIGKSVDEAGTAMRTATGAIIESATGTAIKTGVGTSNARGANGTEGSTSVNASGVNTGDAISNTGGNVSNAGGSTGNTYGTVGKISGTGGTAIKTADGIGSSATSAGGKGNDTVALSAGGNMSRAETANSERSGAGNADGTGGKKDGESFKNADSTSTVLKTVNGTGGYVDSGGSNASSSGSIESGSGRNVSGTAGIFANIAGIGVSSASASGGVSSSIGGSTSATGGTSSVAGGNLAVTCVDKMPECKRYAGMGLCYDPSVRGQMYVNCQASCGIGECCVDRTSDCSKITPQQCFSSPQQAFLLENCVKTCTKCNCQDNAINCPMWKDSCHDPALEAVLRSQCAATCGFC